MCTSSVPGQAITYAATFHRLFGLVLGALTNQPSTYELAGASRNLGLIAAHSRLGTGTLRVSLCPTSEHSVSLEYAVTNPSGDDVERADCLMTLVINALDEYLERVG